MQYGLDNVSHQDDVVLADTCPITHQSCAEVHHIAVSYVLTDCVMSSTSELSVFATTCLCLYSRLLLLALLLLCRKHILLGLEQAGSKAAKAIQGRFSMARSHEHRGIDMSVEYSPQFYDGSHGASETQIFSMTMSS